MTVGLMLDDLRDCPDAGHTAAAGTAGIRRRGRADPGPPLRVLLPIQRRTLVPTGGIGGAVRPLAYWNHENGQMILGDFRCENRGGRQICAPGLGFG